MAMEAEKQGKSAAKKGNPISQHLSPGGRTGSAAAGAVGAPRDGNVNGGGRWSVTTPRRRRRVVMMVMMLMTPRGGFRGCRRCRGPSAIHGRRRCRGNGIVRIAGKRFRSRS